MNTILNRHQMLAATTRDTITLEELRRYAEKIGQRPAILYPEDVAANGGAAGGTGGSGREWASSMMGNRSRPNAMEKSMGAKNA